MVGGGCMAGRKEFRKSITFRLNLDREDERELYETIRKHSRHVAGDEYGSAGAYIKAALRDTGDRKRMSGCGSSFSRIWRNTCRSWRSVNGMSL